MILRNFEMKGSFPQKMMFYHAVIILRSVHAIPQCLIFKVINCFVTTLQTVHCKDDYLIIYT